MKLAGKSILVLTSGPLCRNPRALKEAWTLGDAGYAVTVITVAHDERFEAIDDELLRRAPFKKIAIDLRGNGARSRMERFVQRIRTWRARRFAQIGIQSPDAFGPYRPLLRQARGHPADLTVAHTEVALCVAGTLASEGRRVAVDFEDWHSEDLLPALRATRPLKLLREMEMRLLRSAIYATAPSEAMATALQEASGGSRPVVLTNSFPLQPISAPLDGNQSPALLWFSQTIGPGRGLEAFFDAWSRTTERSRLHLVGDVAVGYRDSLAKRVASTRRGDLAFLPLVPPWQLPALLSQYQVGLALEASTPRSRDLTITNKILQYLNAGLAVIATPTSGQREVFSHAPGAGISVDLDSPAALAAQLDSLFSDREGLAAMRRSARRAAESVYCWEKESHRLLELVERALQTPTPTAS